MRNSRHTLEPLLPVSILFFSFLVFFFKHKRDPAARTADFWHLLCKDLSYRSKPLSSLLYFFINEKSFFFQTLKRKTDKNLNFVKNRAFYPLAPVYAKKINFFTKNSNPRVSQKRVRFSSLSRRPIKNYYGFIRLFYKKKNYGFFILSDRALEIDLFPRITRLTPDFSKFFVLKASPSTRVKKKYFFFNEASAPSNNVKLSWSKRYDMRKKFNHQPVAFKLQDRARNFPRLKKKNSLFNFLKIAPSSNLLFENKKIPVCATDGVFKKIKIFIGDTLPLSANIEFFLSTSFFYLMGKNSVYTGNSGFKNNFFHSLLSFLNFNFSNFFFYTKISTSYANTNVLAANAPFSFIFKKHMIKTFNNRMLSSTENPFHYEALTHFLEYYSGKKIYLTLNPFTPNMLNFEEKLRCMLWSQKIKSFRKVLGPRLFLNESLQIVYFCLKNKDVFLLSSWMLQMFYKISFWKYKLFFRYLQYVLRYFFWGVFDILRTTGIKFQMKGKVSVAGNARTRTVLTKVGTAGHATFKNRILHDLKLIRTFTGVIGFKTWIFF